MSLFSVMQCCLILAFGVAVSTGIVAVFIYKPIEPADDEIVSEQNIHQNLLDYYKMYEIHDVDNNSCTLDEIKRLTDNVNVSVNSPLGEVEMLYDADKSHFAYRCNRGTLPFKLLETVARAVVIKTNCKSCYLDFNSAVETLSQSTQPSTQFKKSTNPVFACFKPYHVKNVKPQLTKNINNFKYHGKIIDKTHEFPHCEKIDYATYKLKFS
jgi:hypothetical protein